MLCNQNNNLESRNFVDNVNFSKNDPSIWIVYPAGASGDLLISVIDKHYLRTGCEYYGIDDTGRVKIYTTDYEMIDIELQSTNKIVFNDQWFFNLADKLGERNLNYSLLDQIIFGCHLYTPTYINYILETFPKAKIINIYPKDDRGLNLIKFLRLYKLNNVVDYSVLNNTLEHHPELVNDKRVLNIPFGLLFNDISYYKCYNTILSFLELEGILICFDYVKFYLSKQHPEIKNLLVEYSKSL
jgi:hypothetical protein